MNDTPKGRKSRLNPFDSGWNCVTCGAYVASSFEDGFPVSRYWRPQTQPDIIEAFCGAVCGLKDYEENKNA
jgi:hypothetical protein